MSQGKIQVGRDCEVAQVPPAAQSGASHKWGQAPRTFLGLREASTTLLRVRVILMPSLLLELHFPGHFTHKVPSGWSLDEGAWSCPRGHPPGGVARNTPGRHPMSGKLRLGWVASGGTAWQQAGTRHTHSSRSPACSSAGPGDTSAGPSCKQPWWWSWKGREEKKSVVCFFLQKTKKEKWKADVKVRQHLGLLFPWKPGRSVVGGVQGGGLDAAHPQLHGLNPLWLTSGRQYLY